MWNHKNLPLKKTTCSPKPNHLQPKYFTTTYIIRTSDQSLLNYTCQNPLPEVRPGPTGAAPSLPTNVPLNESVDISVIRRRPPPLQQPLRLLRISERHRGSNIKSLTRARFNVYVFVQLLFSCCLKVKGSRVARSLTAL